MLVESLLTATINDLTELCLKQQSGDEIKDSAKVEAKDLPEGHPLKVYVSKRQVADIVTDIINSLSFLEGKRKGSNDLIKFFSEFLTTEGADFLDFPKEKWSYGSSHLGKAMKSFNKLTYHKSARLFATFLTKYNLAPVKYIQTPIQLSLEDRVEMRRSNPGVFFVFLTDQTLLGGIRLSANGKIIDNSWLGRVQRFTQHAKS